MKNRFGIAVLMAACLLMTGGMTGCSNDDDNDDLETVINVNRLPDAARAFINTYYPSATVRSVMRDVDDGIVVYEVDFTNGHEVTFDSRGEWIEVDAPDGQSIPAGIVPVAIETYLDANYSGYGVNDITRTGMGYEVELVTGVDLLFDSLGNFLGIDH